MKRVLALALAMVMALSLAACGGSGEGGAARNARAQECAAGKRLRHVNREFRMNGRLCAWENVREPWK